MNEIWLQLAYWLLRKCLKLTMTLTFSPTNLHLLIMTTLIPIFMPKSSKLSMKSYVIAFSRITHCRKKVSQMTVHRDQISELKQ